MPSPSRAVPLRSTSRLSCRACPRSTGASRASRAPDRNLRAASGNKKDVNAAPDAGLVASTLAGNEDAFTLLVERHRPRIRRVAHVLLGDWAEAEDVAQDTLLVAHATLERLRDPERFGAWLTAITTNLAKTRLRSRRAGWTSLPGEALRRAQPCHGKGDEHDRGRAPGRDRSSP